MKKRIFVINGYAATGKSTFCSMISSIVPSKTYSSVQDIKQVAKILGWDGSTKDEKTRKFLSDLKILSAEYNDHPYNMLVKTIKEFYEDTIHEWLFLHVREPGEIFRLKTDFPEIIRILVVNPNVAQITSNMADANVFSCKYDEVIENDSDLSHLKQKANEFIEKYREEKDEQQSAELYNSISGGTVCE